MAGPFPGAAGHVHSLYHSDCWWVWGLGGPKCSSSEPCHQLLARCLSVLWPLHGSWVVWQVTCTGVGIWHGPFSLELVLMILLDPFQLRLFCDYSIFCETALEENNFTALAAVTRIWFWMGGGPLLGKSPTAGVGSWEALSQNLKIKSDILVLIPIRSICLIWDDPDIWMNLLLI